MCYCRMTPGAGPCSSRAPGSICLHSDTEMSAVEPDDRHRVSPGAERERAPDHHRVSPRDRERRRDPLLAVCAQMTQGGDLSDNFGEVRSTLVLEQVAFLSVCL